MVVLFCNKLPELVVGNIIIPLLNYIIADRVRQMSLLARITLKAQKNV